MRKDIRFDASNNFHETWGAEDNYEMHVENTISAPHFHTEIPAAAISDKRGVCIIMIRLKTEQSRRYLARARLSVLIFLSLRC